MYLFMHAVEDRSSKLLCVVGRVQTILVLPSNKKTKVDFSCVGVGVQKIVVGNASNDVVPTSTS